VLVDAWHLRGFSANRGIGAYLRGVLPHLSAEHDLDVVGLAPRDTDLPAGVRRRTIRRVAPKRFAQREHDLYLPSSIRGAIRAHEADVVFSPADNPPRRCARPWVQMLLDLIPLIVDDPAFKGPADRWRRVGGRLRSANRVLTCSQSTAEDAIRLLGLDPARVQVVPLGVGAEFRPPKRREPDTPPTILYVGEYGPHKGFAEAFAVAGAAAVAGLPHQLEMVGFLAPWHEPSVHRLLGQAPRSDRVTLLGYVDDVIARYQRADALIVTSRYEGFCLPALEAMACGTPVVAFANSAIPEVVGDGGVLVPDGDVRALSEALQRVLCDPSARHELSIRGVERARAFSWERCAALHASALRDSADGSSD
jgi:glycosyltransferase involved in cell wall biosynthesis